VQPSEEYQNKLSQSLQQCTGALRLANLDDAARLIEALMDAVQHTLYQKVTWTEEVINTLAYPLFIIPRYIRWVQESRYRGGPLLLDAINNLRQLGVEKTMVESALMDIVIDTNNNPFANISVAPDVNIKTYVKKLLPLFNRARRAIDKQPMAALDLLNKVAKQLQKLCGNARLAELFWLFGAVIEAMKDGELRVTRQRKQWLLLVEQHITMLYKQPDTMLQRPLSVGVKREFLALLALSASQQEKTQKIIKLYHLPTLPYSDRDIEKGLERFHRPSSDTYIAIYESILQNIEAMRPHLENVLNGQTLEEEPREILIRAINEIVAAVKISQLPETEALAECCLRQVYLILETPDAGIVEALSSQLLSLPERFRLMGDLNMSIEEKRTLMALDDVSLLHNRIQDDALRILFDSCDQQLATIEQGLEIDLLQKSATSLSFYIATLTLIHNNLQLACPSHQAISLTEALSHSIEHLDFNDTSAFDILAHEMISLRQAVQNNCCQSLH